MNHQPAGAAPRTRHRAVPLMLVTALGTSALAAVSPAAAASVVEQAGSVRERPAHQASRSAAQLVAAAPAPTLAVLGAPVRSAQPTYRVRAGDTVSHIALRTGVSVSAIIAANSLRADGFIRAGQTLVVPSGSSAAKAPAATSAPSSGSYTVRRGDTVSHIAARHGTTVRAVIAANGLSSNGFIREGQRLSVPGASGTAKPAGAASKPAAVATGSYTVRAGDTLSHIAVRTKTTVSALRATNPSLDREGTLQIGQRLAVPTASSPSSAPMSNTFLGRTYPDATVRSATVNRDALAARSVPSRAQMQSMIAATARQYGVDPALAQAVAYQESGFNMRAVSPANAVGVMQVIPSSGQWTSELVGRQLDLLDPQDNVTAGVVLLRAHQRTGADQATVIAAYYQGMSSVKRNGFYSDTRRYVASVQTLMGRYR